MKVRVSIPNAYMAMDLEEESALMAFRKITELLCSYGAAGEGEKVPCVDRFAMPANAAEELEAAEGLEAEEEPEAAEGFPELPAKIRPPKATEKYSGFLYIKCKECGYSRGFCARIRTDEYRCGCGAVTELRGLVPLYVDCECGGKAKYLTNMEEDAFDINCIGCGAPVAVRRNEKKGLYETIR